MVVIAEEEASLHVEVDTLEEVMGVQENLIPKDPMVDVIVMSQEAEVVEEVLQEDPDLVVVIDIQVKTDTVEVKDQRDVTVTDSIDMREEVDMKRDIKIRKNLLMTVTQEVVNEENGGSGTRKSMRNQEKEDPLLDEEVVPQGEVIHLVAEEILDDLIVVDQNVEAHVAVDLVVVEVLAEVVESVEVSADVEVIVEDIPVDMIDMNDHPGKATEIGMVPVNEEVVVKIDMEEVNDFKDTGMKMAVVTVAEELVVVDLLQEEGVEDVDLFQAEEDLLVAVVEDLSVKTTKLFSLDIRVTCLCLLTGERI